MFNTTLLLATLLVGPVSEEADTVISKRVNLDEVTVTEFKQNKHNLTPSSISIVNSQFLSNH